jgi:hypothetical protein
VVQVGLVLTDWVVEVAADGTTLVIQAATVPGQADLALLL